MLHVIPFHSQWIDTTCFIYIYIYYPSAPTTPFLPPLRLQGKLPGQVRRGQKCNKHWRKRPNHLASGMIMPMDASGCHYMPLDANLATFFGGQLMWSLPPRYWLSLFRWRRCKQKVRPVVCADRQANRSVTMQRNQEGWRQIDIGYEGSLQSCQTYLHLESCEINKTWKCHGVTHFPKPAREWDPMHLSCSKTPSSRA